MLASISDKCAPFECDVYGSSPLIFCFLELDSLIVCPYGVRYPVPRQGAETIVAKMGVVYKFLAEKSQEASVRGQRNLGLLPRWPDPMNKFSSKLYRF